MGRFLSGVGRRRSPRTWALVALMACLSPGALTAQEGVARRALLVGVGDYQANDDRQNQIAASSVPPDLAGPANDVLLMARVLTTRFGFRPGDVRVLSDAAATRAAIVGALESLVQTAGPDDVVYIHFSGYGSLVPDQNGDETDGWDETLLPYDARTPGVADITDDEIDAIVGQLVTPDVLVVLDAGHAPMPTAAGSDVRVRAAGTDDRAELYGHDGDRPPGPSVPPGYVVMNAAAPSQYALEGQIDGDRSYGWFSWSLARALSRGDRRQSADQLHQRVQQVLNNLGDRIGLRSPASTMTAHREVREGPLLGANRLRAGDPHTATRAWAGVNSTGDGEIIIEQGAVLGAVAGSLWAIYPPATEEFTPAAMVATAEVSGVRGTDATARLDGGGRVTEGSRAVLLAPAPPIPEVPVWLRRVSPDDRAVLARVLSQSRRVEFVESGRGARFIVNLDSRGCRVFGPGGLQIVDQFQSPSLEQTAQRLAKVFERSARLAHLQALDNPSGTIEVDIGVNPIDVDGMPRLAQVPGARDVSSFRVRRPDEPRAPDNSLMMHVRVSQPAYITVVDIGPDGGLAPFFPNSVSDERNFYPDGLIPFGQEVRIPDSLAGGNAGFFIDYEPPLGSDTLRVFAAGDPLTAARIRDYLGRYLLWVDGEGSKPDFQDIFLPVEMPAVKAVGTELTGFGAPMGAGATSDPVFGTWAASSVSFRIDE